MFYDFIRISLITGIVIVLLLLFFKLVRGRYVASLKYWIWILLALRLMIPVTVTLPEKAAEIPAVRTVAERQYQLRENFTRVTMETEQAAISAEPEKSATTGADTPQTTPETTTKPELETGKFSWYQLIVGFWAAGVVVFLGYHGMVNYSFRRYVRRWGWPAQDKEIRELVLRAKRNCGLKCPLRLLILENIASPMVAGLFRPILLLPQEEWDATELYYVLRHELTHIKRRDTLYKALLLLCNGLHWFNPAVWIMRYRAYQTLEICCDMTVVEGATRGVRMQYCETIMATAQRSAGLGMAATFGSTKKSIMERFKEIFSEKRKKRGTAVLLVVLAVAVLAGCSISLGAALVGDQAELPEPLSTGQSADKPVEEEPVSISIPENTVTLSSGLVIPGEAAGVLLPGDGETVVLCQVEGETLFSILKLDANLMYQNYRWSYERIYDNWPTQALAGWDYMLGQQEQFETCYILRCSDSTLYPESQALIESVLDLNGIVSNPCLVAEPYYRAEDPEGAIAAMQALSDPETVAGIVLEKLKNGTNTAGAGDEILEAFAQYLGGHWDAYIPIRGDEYLWNVEYDDEGRLTLKIIRQEPVTTEIYYSLFYYQDGQVVNGPTMGWLEPYEAPDGAQLLAQVDTSLAQAEGAEKVSEGAMNAISQWIADAQVFLEQYASWEWRFTEVTEKQTVLLCTGPAGDTGITPFVRLTFDGETGKVTSESGNEGAGSGITGCVRLVAEERPGDMEAYMVHEHDVKELYQKDVTEVLAEQGAPEHYYPDDGSGTISMSYPAEYYLFFYCSACSAYHLGMYQVCGEGIPLLGIQVGDPLETVLDHFEASGAEPSYTDYIYQYDSDYYGTYTPVADTGLVNIRIEMGKLNMDISFDRNRKVRWVEVAHLLS